MAAEQKKGDVVKGALFVLGVWFVAQIAVRPVVNKAVQMITPKNADGTAGKPFIQL